MSRLWVAQRERGNRFWLKVIHWIATNIGRTFARILLFPITLYFFLTSRATRKASGDYLKRVLPKRPTLLDIFRHHLTFSSTILDRVYFLTNKYDLFDIKIYNEELFRRFASAERGFLLLGAHVGSFEILRALGLHHLRDEVGLKVLMYHEHGQAITEFLNMLNPDLSGTVIPMGTPGTVYRVLESIENGDVVGMLGDRHVKNDKTLKCAFLGGDALFPTGPSALAVTLRVPVLLFYGTYHGGNRYEIEFELLCDAPADDAKSRKAMIGDLTQRYVASLERHVRKAPYNWFNFYAFWEEE